MSSFKSPELHICGRIIAIIDQQKPQSSTFYAKCKFLSGEEWSLISGTDKFQTFQSQSLDTETIPLQQPFNLHYIAKSMRGWPRIMLQVWKVDQYGRHNLHGYSISSIPFQSGQYKNFKMYCWRPMGSWYDRFIGANSELQYPGMIASSLNRYGLRTFSSCQVKLEINVIGRGWQLHGIQRE